MSKKRTIGLVRRSETTTVEGNLVEIRTPKFLTLTGKPANQRPFPVIRSDNGESTMSKTTKPARITRTKRNDNPILRVTFPAAYEDQKVNDALADMGLTGYTIQRSDTEVTALRSDLQTIAKQTTDIKLTEDGITISLDAAQHPLSSTKRSDNLSLVSVSFDVKRFDEEAVNAWISQNGVDTNQFSVENSGDELITVTRNDAVEGEDTRKIEIEDGLVVTVARSDENELPDGIIAVVSEAAYGNWGWGQLDFNAAMADRAFCDAMDQSMHRLWDVLWRIVFYSELPLVARKELVNRSLSQFGEFVGNVIDALPRQILLSVARSSADSTQEKSTMTQKDQTSVQSDETVKRSEVQAMIDSAVAAALSKNTTETKEEVQRSDEQAKEEKAEVKEAPVSEEDAPLKRSDLKEFFAEAMKPLVEQIAEVKTVAESTVVVRSDNDDPATKEVANVKRSVFSGAVFGDFKK